MTLLLIAGRTHAQEVSAGIIKPPAVGEKGVVALFNIQNSGMYTAYLMSAESDAAGKIEFHDAAKGPEAQKYIAIEPGDVKTMSPSGVYVYLTELKRPLNAGEVITVTFKNEGEIPIAVTAKVQAQ